MNNEIKPSFGRVLIKIIKQKQDSGIFIPSNDNKNVQKSEVIAVGRMNKEESIEIKIGDFVYYSKFSASILVESSAEDYAVVKIEDVLGVENGK